MKSPIDELEEEVWNNCVRRRASQGKKNLEDWQVEKLNRIFKDDFSLETPQRVRPSSKLSQIFEDFTVQELPERLRPLENEAVLQWQEIENGIFAELGRYNKQEFLEEFVLSRDSYMKNSDDWTPFIFSVGEVVYGKVRNMDWVNLFAWVLPEADKNWREKNSSISIMVTCFFYCELLYKYGKTPSNERQDIIERIDARWRIVMENEDYKSLVIKKTESFFECHIKDSVIKGDGKKKPSFEWLSYKKEQKEGKYYFIGDTPNNEFPGCYLFVNEQDEIIYIGVGASKGQGIYKDCGIGARVSNYLGWDKKYESDKGRAYIFNSKDKKFSDDNIIEILTFGIPKEVGYLAYALEAYLINEFKPKCNSSLKTSQ